MKLIDVVCLFDQQLHVMDDGILLLLKCNVDHAYLMYIHSIKTKSLLSRFGKSLYIYAVSVLNCRKCELSAYGYSKLIQCRYCNHAGAEPDLPSAFSGVHNYTVVLIVINMVYVYYMYACS